MEIRNEESETIKDIFVLNTFSDNILKSASGTAYKVQSSGSQFFQLWQSSVGDLMKQDTSALIQSEQTVYFCYRPTA